MLRVGLTGGIGSGKSAVAAAFAELGIPVVDTDQIAHQLSEPGQPVYLAMVAEFGTGIIGPHGRIDRAALRQLVFANPGLRARLEAITHPLIRAETEARLAELDEAYAIVVVPLLVEAGWMDLVDRVLVVDTDPGVARRRAADRDGLNEADIAAIQKSQTGRDARLAAADDLLSNDGGHEDLRAAVARLHERYAAWPRS
ncbi:MAG: dephospho-CoA kinase [Chromatiales bacterium]|nr:dephospho-CoA kinase [Chromatiales bacterium]